MTLHERYTLITETGIYRVPENTTQHTMLYELNNRYLPKHLKATALSDSHIKVICRHCDH